MKNIIDKSQIDVILLLDNHFFIKKTYDLLLKRPPDFDGYINYFKLLKKGTKKIDVFLSVFRSKERASCNPDLQIKGIS